MAWNYATSSTIIGEFTIPESGESETFLAGDFEFRCINDGKRTNLQARSTRENPSTGFIDSEGSSLQKFIWTNEFVTVKFNPTGNTVLSISGGDKCICQIMGEYFRSKEGEVDYIEVVIQHFESTGIES